MTEARNVITTQMALGDISDDIYSDICEDSDDYGSCGKIIAVVPPSITRPETASGREEEWRSEKKEEEGEGWAAVSLHEKMRQLTIFLKKTGYVPHDKLSFFRNAINGISEIGWNGGLIDRVDDIRLKKIEPKVKKIVNISALRKVYA